MGCSVLCVSRLVKLLCFTRIELKLDQDHAATSQQDLIEIYFMASNMIQSVILTVIYSSKKIYAV